MVLKEIKQFAISQMKESDWVYQYSTDFMRYESKHIVIKLNSVDKTSFNIKIPNGYDLTITRSELGLNAIHFWILMRYVKKSSKNAEKRKRGKEISSLWGRFLERNKDLKRDNRINQVLDK